MKKRRIENLRERDRQARAQMSSQGQSSIQEAVPMFEPPVKVNPGATDRVTQEIRNKLGDFYSVKHLLDDPKSSIGVYGEPPSPAPGGGPSRGSEFKKPHYASSQNNRPYQRTQYYSNNKYPDGMSLVMPNRLPSNKIYNGKTPPNINDPGGNYSEKTSINYILKEMKSLPCPPLSDIAATPRKEVETFSFTALPPQRPPLEPLTPIESKPCPQQNNHLDRHSDSSGRKCMAQRLSTDLEGDLRLTDSEDEARKRMLPQPATKSATVSSSGSESTPSDSDSDSSSDDSKHNGENRSPPHSPPPEPDEPPEVVEGPGDLSTAPQRPSWCLRNFAPQQPAGVNSATSPRSARPSPNKTGKSSPRINGRTSPGTNRTSPRCAKTSSRNGRHDSKGFNISSTAPGSNASSSSRTSTNNVESDSCSDSTKEVETVLAESKGKPIDLLSGISDSEDESDSNELQVTPRNGDLGSNSERNGLVNRGANRSAARRSPRTPARPRPPSSPSASEDEAPPRPARPDPEKRKGRGRPRKLRTEEESVKRKRGRPPKAKPQPRAPPQSSDDERSPSSPPVSSHQLSDSEAECTFVATDKKKNNILGKLFCPVGGAKGGGKGGGKGGKGKGQVMIIEAHTLDHDKNEDTLQQRLKEEEAYKRYKEEEIQRKLIEEMDQKKREDVALRKQREESLQKRAREEENLKRKEEERLKELNQRRIKEEEAALERKRLKDEEAHRRKLDEEAMQKRKEKEALQKRMKEEEMWQKKRREEEALQKRLREEELRKDEELQNRLKDEDLLHRRYRDEEQSQLKSRDVEPSPRKTKEEDVLQKRIRDDEAAQRRLKVDNPPDPMGNSHNYGRVPMMVQIDLRRLGPDTVARLARSTRPLKRPPPPPPAPPDKKQKFSRQNPETSLTNHERVENNDHSRVDIYYSYLEHGDQDDSEEEGGDHKYYLSEATRLRTAAERESDPLRRVMLYQESVLCFVLTGRVLELELDTKKAFTMYRETLAYIKSIHAMPGRCRASPFSTLTKLDILSFRCQSLLCLRMFKMYKREVKDYNKILQEYNQKSLCMEAVGTVSPLSPTPSPAGSVGSIGSTGSGSSGYVSSGAPAATPQHTPGSTPALVQMTNVAMPAQVHNAMMNLVKFYTFLHMSHDLWEQADSLIKENRCLDLFIIVDKAVGPLTMHSSFLHLNKYIRYAISLLKLQGRHTT